MPSHYYDIDAILAEEELVPCTTNFDFSHLGHLDPDNLHDKHYLPEGTRIKLPLWALEKWASLDFVHLGLPRHYSRRARERLEAAPSEVNVRCVFLLVNKFLCLIWPLIADHEFSSSVPTESAMNDSSLQAAFWWT